MGGLTHLAEAGAAVMLSQNGLTAARLKEELVGLLGDRERLRAMGERARGLARPGALERIVGLVVGLVEA